jgi:glucose-1-phosphate cytidylyltransferase
MKVVLFCGGLGTRLRDYSDQLPKPLVEVGSRPILWHLMRYYAHYGHKEFILCLGYGATAIKNYFVNYNECISNDFVLEQGGRRLELLARDIDDWRITFVDTGLHSNIGQRLLRVREHVGEDDVFLANYSDALTDLNCSEYVDAFLQRREVACFLSVPPPHTFHIVHADSDRYATRLEHVADSPVRINGGYFVFRREIFDYIREGEELVVKPFERLIERRQLLAVPYGGFWRNMDTFKDKIQFDELVARGETPWQVWRSLPPQS